MMRWIAEADLHRLERRLESETDARARLRLLDLIQARRERLGLDRYYSHGLQRARPDGRAE